MRELDYFLYIVNVFGRQRFAGNLPTDAAN